MAEVVYSEAAVTQAFWEVVAYFAAAAVGALVFSAGGLGHTSLDVVIVGALIVFMPIVLVIAPFWVVVTFVAKRFLIENLPTYCVSATLLGLVLAPTFNAALPALVWDSEPELLNYSGRWLRAFENLGLVYAAAGVAAGTVYWALAVWRGHFSRLNRQPL